MSEIKWIEGGTRELRNQGDFGGYCSYDYPEFFPYWCDSGYSVLCNEYHYG